MGREGWFLGEDCLIIGEDGLNNGSAWLDFRGSVVWFIGRMVLIYGENPQFLFVSARIAALCSKTWLQFFSM